MLFQIALISGYAQIKNIVINDDRELACNVALGYVGAWAFVPWDYSLMCKVNRVIVFEGYTAIAKYETVGAPVKPVLEEYKPVERSSMGAYPEDSKFWYPR